MNEVIWHPYPEEIPKEDKMYLITYYCKNIDRSFVDIALYDSCFYEIDSWGVNPIADETISAWAELPKPYEKEEKV